ncbi:hypothetical protein EB118_12290 [bacterium]|nr:hypothetical protein [bacterium]NDD83474.1 hypothetical protein [bacterium]NDG30837.1 hypothetical protein [bacterium]
MSEGAINLSYIFQNAHNPVITILLLTATSYILMGFSFTNKKLGISVGIACAFALLITPGVSFKMTPKSEDRSAQGFSGGLSSIASTIVTAFILSAIVSKVKGTYDDTE